VAHKTAYCENLGLEGLVDALDPEEYIVDSVKKWLAAESAKTTQPDWSDHWYIHASTPSGTEVHIIFEGDNPWPFLRSKYFIWLMVPDEGLLFGQPLDLPLAFSICDTANDKQTLATFGRGGVIVVVSTFGDVRDAVRRFFYVKREQAMLAAAAEFRRDFAQAVRLLAI